MEHISSRHVPHEGPEDAELFFIGDSPGYTDNEVQRPFMGRSGDILEMALQNFGLSRSDVRLGNIMNYRIGKGQNVHSRTVGAWQLDESQKYLRDCLRNNKHKVIIPLGEEALDFIAGEQNIRKRRGSVYQGDGYWIVPSVHPDDVSYDGSLGPAFIHDIEKAIRVSKEGFEEHHINYLIDPDLYQLQGILPALLSAPRLTVDIETKKYTTYIRCIGFAWSPTDAICIYNDAPYTEGQQCIGPTFKHFVSQLLESNIPKTFHNGMFDTIMLEHYNGFSVNRFEFDTMVAQHVLQPELPIGLDYCTSMYTNINYYKDDGKESGDKLDRRKLGIYNCKDVIATWITEEEQKKEFDETTLDYFQYKMKQIKLARHFSTTGMFVNEPRRGEIRDKIVAVREEDMTTFIAIQLMMGVEPFKATQHQKVKDFLYGTLDLPVKKDSDGTITADEDAVVGLIATVEKKLQDLKTDAAKQIWQIRLATLKLLLKIRGYDKLLSSYINIEVSLDGRARSWYKFWGTETGRWSAGMWHDGTGLNGQTIPREGV